MPAALAAQGASAVSTFCRPTVYPALKTALKQHGIARLLYDDANLRALINFCARKLQRQFESRDVHAEAQNVVILSDSASSGQYAGVFARSAQLDAVPRGILYGAGNCPPLETARPAGNVQR